MKAGENYIDNNGDSSTKYIINKVMSKTVDVTVIDSYQGCEWNSNRFRRYSKELLIDQLKTAIDIRNYKPELK